MIILSWLVILASLLRTSIAFGHEDYEIFRLKDALLKFESANTTFYDFLGVKPAATLDQINKAYRFKSRQLHPDKNRGVKYATERFARLATVVEVLRSTRRGRYDHFLKAGFPSWRGTGYYYDRFRPGILSVIVFLYLIGSVAHYVALALTANEDRKRMERYIAEVRIAVGVVGHGQKRKVQSSDGKGFMVDENQDVFLMGQEEVQYPLDVHEIQSAQWRNTMLVRMPLWVWAKTVGRYLVADGESAQEEVDVEPVVVKSMEKPRHSNGSVEEKVLGDGKVIGTARQGPGGRRLNRRK